MSDLYLRFTMNAAQSVPHESLLCALYDNWDAIDLDRSHSQSAVDPIDMAAPAEHRHVWLNAASTERIMGAPGWAIALLPAAIDQDACQRPFRHLFRLQVFRKPGMDPHEQATDYNAQCCARVYWGGQLAEVVP
ncbi:unnamed protein product [Vitrella brassicaformis CCMP3155]|uniref:Uncharacterized protein n=1 Tax=Vitrella brassicaformis (strain CCMP3155) TaxID=1169540 RepID=A0A0G4EIR6_VITBC|nr:unnamed protein product [Vitrella brassicaformis CCMP3155]|eukprot:CEL95792.1 unnamed protein product [Vitrella brassicaformis CCMP3155]